MYLNTCQILATIKKAKELLNKDGMLFLKYLRPIVLSEYLKKNNFSQTRYLESGRHNFFFKKLIRQIAENFNLKIEYLETNGFDIQTILLEEFENEITDKIINIKIH